MKDLAQKINKGDWSFPKSIEFSIQGLDFLNCTLQYDATKRLNWQELVNHDYFKIAQGEVIPITFNTNEGHGKILMNNHN